MNTIYLDNGATSWPKAPDVSVTMERFIRNEAVNIGRGGYDRAYETADLIQNCREKLALLFGAQDSRNVTFTLNVTHALNTLIYGMFTREDHVLVSALEHNAVMRPLTELGIPYTLIPCTKEGYLITERIPSLIRENTKGLILTAASNVCGSIQPVKEAAKIAKDHGLLIFIDAAQLPPDSSLSVKDDHFDAIAFTGHKSLLGPQGVGGIVFSKKTAHQCSPWACGGTGSKSDELAMPSFLPDRFEGGTQNLPGIVGLSAALDFVIANKKSIVKHEMSLTKKLLSYFNDDSRISVIGPKDCTNRTSVISVDFPDLDNAEVAYKLFEDSAIETRVGLHCAPVAHRSLGTFPRGTVRFSLGYATTEKEIDRTIEACKRVLDSMSR
ncbi:MAG: aminotransferase class V-fold PLP-dependent enzyme [Sphaerochaetaceae bacterium]|nr:aminotransferase class V-fold PLP-dependent enzyme [Sphaerochaetaceae bacterium]